MTTVLVDAENVRRSVWPNIAPAELVRRCHAWAVAEDLAVVVVFDGDAPVGAVGTGADSADDWIAREAGRLRAAAAPFWLVTSDRELRERAGAGAARVIGGGAFARALPGG